MFDRIKTIFLSLYSFLRLCVEIPRIPNGEIFLVFSHSASESGGAPVVLYELITELKKQANIIFLSKRGGGLLKQCRNIGIHSYVYGYFSNLYIKVLINHFDIKNVIINTVVCGDCIPYLQKHSDIKILWWIHENDEIFKIMKRKLPAHIEDSVEVKCVSASAQESFKRYYPDVKTSLMFYGMPDLYTHEWREKRERSKKKNCWTLLCIGQICERKNQNMLLKAWSELNKNILKESKLIIIGAKEDDSYAHEFEQILNNIVNVTYLEFVPRNEIGDVYMNADALICPSLSDPLPVVATEAFMYCIPCILSDRTGQASMVINDYNAFLFDPNSPDSIKNAIERAYSQRANHVGELGREIFTEHFSIEKIISDVLKCCTSE